jgi:hypothetical protein
MADNMDIFMHAERIQESGNNYASVNASGHFGAYQFDISTWVYALSLAGLQYIVFSGVVPSLAPASVQDAAARALMSKYYGEFGNSFYNVAEAWYGGPGAVGHPNEGGGPGFPTVGEYAAQVIAKYNALSGTGGAAPAPGTPAPAYTAATLLELLLAVNQEAVQRGLGDAHSREQAAAATAAETNARIEAINNTRQQAGALVGAEQNARIEAINHTREQAAALVGAEQNARIEAINHTREQAAALVGAEENARIEAINNTRQQAGALVGAEQNARIEAIDHTRQQVAAAEAALSASLIAQIQAVLKYAQTIPGLVDQRAAAGYDPTLRARANALTRLLDTVVAHDPLAASLVSNLATFAVDLAGVEDPVLRIAAQLILKQVIDRLGIDTALHAMLSDLVGGILGGGQPKTLQAVTGDIGNRLDALEATQANLAPLAPEADQLHEMGTLIFDAGLLAYFAAAVADPVATANDTVTVLAPVADPLLAPVRAMLGM